jgi:flagellar basal body P-ring formation protein FlgA
MARTATLLLFLALASPAAAQVTPQAAPILKPTATVSGDIVRIGDLIENAGAVAEVAIFRSPDPGTTGIVPTTRIVEAVRARVFGLDTNGIAEVSVTRAGRAVGLPELEARIARALAAQYGFGEAKNVALTFDREFRTLHVEPADADLQIVRLHYDRRTARFDVSFEMPGRPRQPMLRFSGSAVETTEVVVLARPLARGDVIKERDVVIERRPKADSGPDVIASSEDAIGLATRRPLRPGQPLRQAELVKPEVVQRNETVTLVYEVPGILLTMRGKAIESGAVGDVVNVLNVQSKRTVQGNVIGPGQVSVTGRTPHAAAAAMATANLNPATRLRRSAE